MPKIDTPEAMRERMAVLSYIVKNEGPQPVYMSHIAKATKITSPRLGNHLITLLCRAYIHHDRRTIKFGKGYKVNTCWFPTQAGINALNRYESDKGTIGLKEQGKPEPKGFTCEVCNYKGKHSNRETFQCPNCLSTYYKGKVHSKGRGY